MPIDARKRTGFHQCAKHGWAGKHLGKLARFVAPAEDAQAVITSISWPRVPSGRACVLNPDSEIGKCCRGCRHAPAAFGNDTALGWGDRSGRGAVESGEARGFC